MLITATTEDKTKPVLYFPALPNDTFGDKARTLIKKIVDTANQQA
jgi:hypothetical protein